AFIDGQVSFFFQAEDGIRDFHVTGVQTCALPISKAGKKVVLLEAQERVLARVAGVDLSRFYEKEHREHGVDLRLGVCVDAIEGRSEERRVGKEGRARWSPERGKQRGRRRSERPLV